MTMRRQALRSSALLATSLFLSLILLFFFTLPSIMAVNGTIARVTVTQRFENPSDRWLGNVQRRRPRLAVERAGEVQLAAHGAETQVLVPKPDASPLASLEVPHDTNQRIAILALVLALLSAVTFILWRYHRRDYASPRRIGRRI
jgi:hypothetical protein